MSSTSATSKIQELGEQGFAISEPKTVIYRGRQHRQTDAVKHQTDGTLERIMRGAGGVLGTVATLPFLGGLPTLWVAGKDAGFYDATLKSAYYGSVKEHVYEELPEEEIQEKRNADGKVERCNPKDSASVQRFLSENKTEWREANGHNFMVGKGRQGISFFYFIPNGDLSKAYSVKFWTAKNGKSIMNTAKQLRPIRSYCAAFEDIETKWEHKIPELATQLKSKVPNITEEEAKAAIRNQSRTLVIDARAGVARVYGPYDPNKVNPDSHRTGVAISLEKDTVEEINRAHGRSMEHKEPLAGEKPFKTPPSRNPLEDLLDQGGGQNNMPHPSAQPHSGPPPRVNLGKSPEKPMLPKDIWESANIGDSDSDD